MKTGCDLDLWYLRVPWQARHRHSRNYFTYRYCMSDYKSSCGRRSCWPYWTSPTSSWYSLLGSCPVASSAVGLLSYSCKMHRLFSVQHLKQALLVPMTFYIHAIPDYEPHWFIGSCHYMYFFSTGLSPRTSFDVQLTRTRYTKKWRHPRRKRQISRRRYSLLRRNVRN